MKKSFFGVFLCTITLSAHALDAKTAAAVVKQYSETIACQITEIADQKNQYKAVKIDSGDSTDGLGTKFVVFWQGDVGCSGGNGTVVPNFTVVEQSGFSSADPVVMPQYKFPDMEIVNFTSMSANKNGLLVITGLAYGPKDQHHFPTRAVKYSLKLIKGQFLKQ